MSDWEHPSDWRWDTDYHDEPAHYSIDVIERPDDHEPARGRRTVPFGFGPRDEQPEWEGNPS